MKTILGAAAIAAIALPGVASAQAYNEPDPATVARDGLRVQANVGYERVNDPEEDFGINYELGSGIAFGGEVGYDIPVSRTVVIGPYAKYDVSNIEDCDGSFCASTDGYFAAGLHVGIAVSPSSQVYLKGGYSELTVNIEGPIDDGTGNTLFLDESETGNGYDFAVGYEQGLGQNAYLRAEVGAGEAKDIYGFDFQRTSISGAIGFRF